LETVRNIVGECFPWFLWVFVGLFTGSYLWIARIPSGWKKCLKGFFSCYIRLLVLF
jgi:hypothetical protein